jgi:hypothetical protein
MSSRHHHIILLCLPILPTLTYNSCLAHLARIDPYSLILPQFPHNLTLLPIPHLWPMHNPSCHQRQKKSHGPSTRLACRKCSPATGTGSATSRIGAQKDLPPFYAVSKLSFLCPVNTTLFLFPQCSCSRCPGYPSSGPSCDWAPLPSLSPYLCPSLHLHWPPQLPYHLGLRVNRNCDEKR